MSNQLKVLSMPDRVDGVRLTTRAIAWDFTAWKVIGEKITGETNICGIMYQHEFVLAADDTTYEEVFEIGYGHPGAAVTRIQIPVCIRRDTNVGFYNHSALDIWLPEPVSVPAGTTLCVRVARGTATAVTYGGIKLIYQKNVPVSSLGGFNTFENYKAFDTGGSGSTAEKIY